MIAFLLSLSPTTKKVVGGGVLLLVLVIAVLVYGWRRERQGQREASVVQLDKHVQQALSDTKLQYHEEALHVATIKKTRGHPRAVSVVAPGRVKIKDSVKTVPVEVTSQLTADSTRLAQDVLVFDTLLLNWHAAINVADSARKSANIWRGQAQQSHWKRNVAVGVTVVAVIASVIHFSHH